MRKSAEAFRTISEVADELGVPKHVLRFWEIKFPQIRPMKRGGGRRYYRPEDVELLCGIRALLHSDGYTIKGVQKILKEQGAEYAKAYGRGEEVGVQPAPLAVKTPDKQASGGKAGSATRARRGGRGRAAVMHPLPDVVASVIAELESCRDALKVAIAGKTETVARKRSRAAAG
jgi:DNA-binding transcriptional MerR regulator